MQNVDQKFLEEWKEKRKKLVDELTIANKCKPFTLISEAVLSTWLISDEKHFVPQPSLLAKVLCKHKRFNPRKAHLLKCIDSEKVYYLFKNKSLQNKKHLLRNLIN